MRKLSLKDLEVHSFITVNQKSVQAGVQALGLEGNIKVEGETLDERPCTFPSMEPEGCR